jgi:hypothetical protein
MFMPAACRIPICRGFSRRRLQATREIPPVEVLRAFSCAAPVNSSREGTTPVEGGLSSGILLECFLARAGEPALKPNPVGSSSMMGFPVHGLNGQ